jgi:tRNA(Ile)-lysidine synthetase-like protein
MKVEIKPGKYMLGVSGGVDSIALLDLLAKKPGIEIVVCHFDHGIRPDSKQDETLVRRSAAWYKLAYETQRADLGPSASEQTARDARYKFLESMKLKHSAKAVITAHHQDDKIETALLNILRGTGRKGLSAIIDNKAVVRPLLNTPKQDLIKYALDNNLVWREDSSNQSRDYLRNYLRLEVLSKATPEQRSSLISNIDKVAKINKSIDRHIATLSQLLHSNHQLSRDSFTKLPMDLGSELIVYWLRNAQSGEFDKKTVARLNMALRTAGNGTRHSVNRYQQLQISGSSAHFSNTLPKL